MSDSYFSDLNYSMANEDPSLELALAQEYRPKSILAVSGSGARFLPLLTVKPDEIVALDLARQQLYIAELRTILMRTVSIDDYQMFWGYPPYDIETHKVERRTLFMSLSLPPSVRDYFTELFTRVDWQGLIYAGKWEKTFTGVPKALRPIFGTYYDRIFEFREKKDQDTYFKQMLKQWRWRLPLRTVVFLLGNASFFNEVLYKGRFVKKNIPDSYFDFYIQAYRRMFENSLARANFFLQLCFFGKIKYEEANPLEAKSEIYHNCATALQQGSRVTLVEEGILDYTVKTDKKFDFVSLSNVASYLSGDSEQRFLQQLRPALNPGAIVVVRCYLRIPEYTNKSGFTDITANYPHLLRDELMQVYNIFIYRYTP